MLVELYTIYNDEQIDIMAENDETFECFYSLDELFKRYGKDCYWNSIDYFIDDFDELHPN